MKKLLFFFLLMLFSSAGIAQEQPNIVFYITDDQSQRDAGIYGAEVVETPNMDRLAARGMTFNRAFIASPACAPSRAALLTGLMPARNGAEANHTYPDPDIPLLTEKLQENGYEVIAFGKVAHGPMNEKSNFDYYEPVPKRGDLSGKVEEYLEENPSDSPRLILVGDHRPHVLWTEKMEYDPENVDLPDYFIDTGETREHRARYYTDISGMDRELGEVMDLAQDRFGDNLLFLFSSDHGGQWPFAKWNLYEAGIKVPVIAAWPGHIEEGSRTNAMVSWIDIFPTLLDLTGGSIPGDLDGRSFAPVLKGETDSHRDHIFTTHSGDGKFNVYPIRSVRTDRYKYILNLLPDHYHSNHSDINRYDGAGEYWHSWEKAAKENPEAEAIYNKYFERPKEEFYDLQEDPTEQNNLIDSGQHQEIISDLRERLQQWMEEQGDRKLIYNAPYPACGPKPTRAMINE
ncbi:sulfatase [Aliifodinibius sp. S!AR15-10]|nr:sulfatase [Aliifodinibius sp. S!AR15-10]